MRAVILAAGKGNRLRPLTDTSHKCLIEIGGRSIAHRYLDDLARLGVEKATMVLGHLAETVRAHVEEWSGPVEVSYLLNTEYERGSILSVAIGSAAFDGDVVMMDCDVIYHPDLMDRLLGSENDSCYLMDTDYEPTAEACLVIAKEGRVVANDRKVTVPYDELGEGLGLLKLSAATAARLKEILQGFVARGDVDVEYEAALEVLLREHVVGYERVDGLPWTEIDFAEDIETASDVTLPAIEKSLAARSGG